MNRHAILWVLLAAAIPAAAAGQQEAGPANPFFALCMDTHDSNKRTLPEQAKLLAELGYDGAGHLWPKDVDKRISTLEAAGLKLYQVYARVSIAPGKRPYDPKIAEVIPLLKGRDTTVALLVTGGKPSDASRDGRAVAIIREIADSARGAGVRVVLYPHANHWLERVEDALRVAEKTGRENVGVMFNLCHWLKAGGQADPAPLLKRVLPRLWAVTVNGSPARAELKAGKGGWILPLGRGSFDVAGLLKTLRGLGYRGPVGLQCYGIRGDARDHLAASIRAWRQMREQLKE